MINIIADINIPHLDKLKQIGINIIQIPHEKITQKTLNQADALLITTATTVNKSLIANTPIQFIASATSGIDHINLQDLNQHNITFSHAPGSNAQAVLEYVATCFTICNSPKKHQRIGIIGLGHVGSVVEQYFANMNYETICHDPPKAQQNPNFNSKPLSALHHLDALCIHPSLTKTKPTPSWHMINNQLLNQQEDNTIIINASRGDVANELALKKHAHRLQLCLDVWHNEPHPDPELISATTIATPHIAGYSALAKWQTSNKIITDLCNYFNLTHPNITPPSEIKEEILTLTAINQTFKQAKNTTATFKMLRKKLASRGQWLTKKFINKPNLGILETT